MCILFLAINAHPHYPLIVCANRDEFHHRPTQAAHWWPATAKSPTLLAGKDLQAGGTWLGMSQTGQFAALTNIRTTSPESTMRSRGELVTMALNQQISLNWLKTHQHQYNPFNLVYQQQNQLYCFNSVTGENLHLHGGFFAVSNGSINDKWPKMSLGEKRLEQVVNDSPPSTLQN